MGHVIMKYSLVLSGADVFKYPCYSTSLETLFQGENYNHKYFSMFSKMDQPNPLNRKHELRPL